MCSRNWCHSSFSDSIVAMFPVPPLFSTAPVRDCSLGFVFRGDAKPENFCCHEPISSSPDTERFAEGGGGAGFEGTAETRGAACSGCVRGLSGAFFFVPAAVVGSAGFPVSMHSRYRQASAGQARNGTGTRTGTSALSGSAAEIRPSA